VYFEVRKDLDQIWKYLLILKMRSSTCEGEKYD
jgi:hypothetical protein